MARDRRAQLIQSTTANGIDFVTIGNAAQTLLQVHFLNAVLSTRLADRADHDHRRRNHTDRERATDQRRQTGGGTTAMRF